MRLLALNPNSSERMTADIARTASACALPGIEVNVVRMPGSPEVLESFADYTLAAAEMLAAVRRGAAEGYDGVLVCCFGDPGLWALKEELDVPVIGIAEAALSRALLLGGRFSVVAASAKARPMMEALVDGYGLASRNAGTVTLGAPIASFLGKPDRLAALVREALAREAPSADVLVLGCAGMTELSGSDVSWAGGRAVIDPVACGISTLSALVADGARVSRLGLFGPPGA